MPSDCRCRVPIHSENPRHGDACVACGYRINPAWTTNNHTTSAFYDRLALCLPTADEDWIVFRAQCEARERAGRDYFGHRFLHRNNIRDATEEFADGSNYLLFDSLRQVRREGEDHDLADVLSVCFHAFKAHQGARLLAGKRQGAP